MSFVFFSERKEPSRETGGNSDSWPIVFPNKKIPTENTLLEWKSPASVNKTRVVF